MNHVVACPRRNWAQSFAKGSRLAVAWAASAALATPLPPAFAQPLPLDQSANATALPGLPTDQLLLEADHLTYDFDRKTVTASGNVQIYYGGTIVGSSATGWGIQTALSTMATTPRSIPVSHGTSSVLATSTATVAMTFYGVTTVV